MKGKFLMSLWWLVIASVSAPAQDKLYPVTGTRDVPVVLTADRSAFVIEKSFQHKLTLGYPTDDKVSVPDTRTPMVTLWLRIQNVSRGPIELNIAKFTSTDDQGQTYAVLALDDAIHRIIAGTSGGSLGTKTLRSLSLGRVANKPTEDQLRDDIVRYSLQSGEVPTGGVKEGLIYFEKPPRKNFTVSVTLGDLWSQPLVFSTAKQK
jgi:hypothetical protein